MNLSAQEISNKPIETTPFNVGQFVPDKVVKDIDGNEVSIIDVLVKKPTVLIFYRGGWCPYCNLHLSELKNVDQEITDLGYQIVAISPDDIEDVNRAVNKKKYNYTVLSDFDGRLITSMGLAFKSGILTRAFAKIRSKGEVSKILPIPSVYIVDQKGEILFKYSDPNYKKRLSSDKIITAIKGLNI